MAYCKMPAKASQVIGMLMWIWRRFASLQELDFFLSLMQLLGATSFMRLCRGTCQKWEQQKCSKQQQWRGPEVDPGRWATPAQGGRVAPINPAAKLIHDCIVWYGSKASLNQETVRHSAFLCRKSTVSLWVFMKTTTELNLHKPMSLYWRRVYLELDSNTCSLPQLRQHCKAPASRGGSEVVESAGNKNSKFWEGSLKIACLCACQQTTGNDLQVQYGQHEISPLQCHFAAVPAGPMYLQLKQL